jgi:bacillithiol biosynthesis cysteine-adding enzyme BshC
VSNPAESSASSGVLRDAIDLNRFPWIRPLVREYGRDYGRVASLFAGNPGDPAAWEQTITRVTRAARDRKTVSAALTAQLKRRGAHQNALEGAAALAKPSSVAIVTGQQAGVFGGPLYTIFKAVTAVQLARRVRATTGVEAVPVFWAEVEDHDWQEIRSARILDKDSNIVDVIAPDAPNAGVRSVGSLEFDAGVSAAVDRLSEQLAKTEFSADLAAALRRHYRAGARVGAAFAGWLDDLLARHGLVVFESDDVSLKPMVTDLFAHEIETRATSKLARAAGESMQRLGHAPQVEAAHDAVALFYMDGAGRRSIRVRGDELVIGDKARSMADLKAEALAHPERFSPNVLLRPLVQDRLFPTACYVGGPAELAYQAQLGGVYREFGVEAPLLYSRASATLLDGAAMRFLERSGLALNPFTGRTNRCSISGWPRSCRPASSARSRTPINSCATASRH